MPDLVWVILFLMVLLFFTAGSLTMLIRPLLFLRHFANSLFRNTAENRVHVRGLGIYFFLFVLAVFSAAIPESAPLHRFHRNILVALAIYPILLAIFLWVLWRFSVRDYIRRLYTEGISEDPAWERRMTLIFCSLLACIIALAFIVRLPWHSHS
jgi:hypothetical protein